MAEGPHFAGCMKCVRNKIARSAMHASAMHEAEMTEVTYRWLSPYGKSQQAEAIPAKWQHIPQYRQ